MTFILHIYIYTHLLSTVILIGFQSSLGALKSYDKAVPGKIHWSGGHSKRNCLKKQSQFLLVILFDTAIMLSIPMDSWDILTHACYGCFPENARIIYCPRASGEILRDVQKLLQWRHTSSCAPHITYSSDACSWWAGVWCFWCYICLLINHREHASVDKWPKMQMHIWVSQNNSARKWLM